ncbi:MAG: RNA polymerase factor sigma-32 [Myxococcales bacterium]
MAKERRPAADKRPAATNTNAGRTKARAKASPAPAPQERERPESDDASELAEDAYEPGEDDAEGSDAPRQDDDALEGEIVDDTEFEREDDAALAGAAEEEDGAESSYELPLKSVPDGGGALTRYDALQAYMRDVHRYEVLDAETQRELAVRYHEAGDLEAARQLVTSNLRLVVKIAYDYRRAYRNVMDLIQEGNIGLMQAVKKYDPYKGVKLSSYAAWWIRAYILRFILNNWRLVKLGTTQAQRKLFFNLSKEKARLAAMGIEPSAENIAKRLDVSAEEVTSMDRRLSAGEMSLDTPVGGDDSKSQSRVDLMPALGTRVDELLADEELGQILHRELRTFGETLTGKERQIFDQRLLAEDPRTLQELGADFGVSRERVRQLEKRLQLRLKKYLEEKLGNEMLEP